MDPRLEPDRFWSRLRSALAEVDDEAARPPPEARVGAVLVLLEDTELGPRVVLTRRRRDMRSHPGQLSFPGGRLDADETVEQAALREADEEIALDGSSLEVLGRGPRFYIPPSRFWVVPVVARWHAPHALTENPWEVDEVLHVPIAHLLDEVRWRHTPLSDRGSAWAWQLDDDLLWGATAIVMSLLLDVAVEGWNGGRAPAELGEARAARPWETAPAWERRARLEGELPARSQQEVVHVTAAQVRSVRAWLDDHGVDALARAEQGGRALAHATRRLTAGGDLTDLAVTVLAGPSSNGAAGLAAARLLAAAGARVDVLVAGAARHPVQVELLEAAGVPVSVVAAEALTDVRSPGAVVVDAMLGIGGQPPLRELPLAVSRWLARHDVPVIAADVPSGLHPDEGLHGACVNADVTVAFGLPVAGLLARIVAPYAGDLYLADLGIPFAAWRAAGVEPTAAFGRGPLVRLTTGAKATDAGTPDQGAVPES